MVSYYCILFKIAQEVSEARNQFMQVPEQLSNETSTQTIHSNGNFYGSKMPTFSIRETKFEEYLLLFPVLNHAQIQSIPGHIFNFGEKTVWERG